MTKDRNKRPAMPDFSELASAGGKGANRTADWTDIEASTATLAFQRDGVHSTADWSVAPGAPQAPRRPGTADWSFEPGTAKDAPLGGDGVKHTADWSDLLGD